MFLVTNECQKKKVLTYLLWKAKKNKYSENGIIK